MQTFRKKCEYFSPFTKLNACSFISVHSVHAHAIQYVFCVLIHLCLYVCKSAFYEMHTCIYNQMPFGFASLRHKKFLPQIKHYFRLNVKLLINSRHWFFFSFFLPMNSFQEEGDGSVKNTVLKLWVYICESSHPGSSESSSKYLLLEYS